jgi:hypothetical protein
MRSGALKWLLALPLALVLLVVAAYFLLGAWLESAGGRQAVERALAERIGLPVTLEGEFDVMLLPAVGVAGTGLVVGQPGPATEVLRSREYAVSLALAPLLERRLSIESVRFEAGLVHLGRWPEAGAAAPGSAPADVRLPDIERLEIHDFGVIVSAGDDQPYRVRELAVEGFAVGHPASFVLEVEDAGRWAGSILWRQETATLDLAATGTGPWPGDVRLTAKLGLVSGEGAVTADWVGAPLVSTAGFDVRVSFVYASAPSGWRIDDLRLAAEPLLVTGEGCLVGEDRPQLHLDLLSERVDLDDLPDLGAFTGTMQAMDGEQAGTKGASAEGPGQAPTPDDAGLDFHVRLSAAELVAGEVVARDAVLQLGAAPDCSGLETSPRE